MAQQNPYKWFFETTTAVEGHAHAIVRTIFALQTEFQRMEILETASYGKCLVLDGRIQSSVADDFIYHETLVHPAMVLHPHPETALVIGGGEGATLREILRYPSIRRAVMVDIDRRVVEACRSTSPRCTRAPSTDARTRAPPRGRPRLARADVRPVRRGHRRPHRAARGGPGLPPVHAGVLPAPERPHDAARHAGAPGRHDQARRAGLLRRHGANPRRRVPVRGALPVVHPLLRDALGLRRVRQERRPAGAVAGDHRPARRRAA